MGMKENLQISSLEACLGVSKTKQHAIMHPKWNIKETHISAAVLHMAKVSWKVFPQSAETPKVVHRSYKPRNQ